MKQIYCLQYNFKFPLLSLAGGGECNYTDTEIPVVIMMPENCSEGGIPFYREEFPRKETTPDAVTIWTAVYLCLNVIWIISALFLEENISSKQIGNTLLVTPYVLSKCPRLLRIFVRVLQGQPVLHPLGCHHWNRLALQPRCIHHFRHRHEVSHSKSPLKH